MFLLSSPNEQVREKSKAEGTLAVDIELCFWLLAGLSTFRPN